MEDEEDDIKFLERRRRSTSQPSIYRSTQSNLNSGSQQTLYHSVRNTMYEDAISMETLNADEEDETSTLRGTEETLIEGSCGDVRGSGINGGIHSLAHSESGSLYFKDGIRSIDFVIVWDEHDGQASAFRSSEYRKIFERNLELEGLHLEHESPEPSGLRFTKIHAPREVLRRYAEILKLRLPMKELPMPTSTTQRPNTLMREVNSCIQIFFSRFYVDQTIFPTMKHRFTAVYSRDKEYLFDLDAPEFFSPATHSRIVQFILDRTRFSDVKGEDFAFGIDRLISEHAYVAAYPLHDGSLRTPDSMRYLLYTHWASLRRFLHYQPLDYIKEYFGVKIGLYFAWLGFYTHMLVPASLMGLLSFAYGCISLSSNQPSEDICHGNTSIDMCPLCDKICGYWDLRETCFHGRLTYLFDNPSTVFFAIFMSLWATLFLELWKKYSAEITHRWDLTGLDAQEEHPRPQYLARLSHVKKKSVNVITNTVEPTVPFWSMRLPATILSFSVVLLLIAVAMAAVIGVILYRMSILTTLSVYGQSAITSNAILFTTATAACLNLCCIVLFNWLYVWLAEYLTEMELLRTQTEFDDSLTLKIYLLQFVNYYASIFYIAFFKGKFAGHPSTYNRLFRYRQEECGPGGCLTELCIQLSIIMIGKQAMNSFLEMMFPLFYKWLNTWKVHVKPDDSLKQERSFRKFPPWVRDYKLVEWGPRSLFPEYLEMVLQYGFVTIFVAAFPLAPFFALLNNVFEMRLDAKKLLTMYRRPVGQRVRDIGIWYRILDSVAKLSVITNGFIIAFTSNFIPKIVYQMSVSENGSLDGFLEYSLSKFNTSDFEEGVRPQDVGGRVVEVCRYPDFRGGPGEDGEYEVTSMYWRILAARLAFVVVFENTVALVMILVRWCIPDMSPELRDRVRREAYITNEIIIQREALRACERGVDEPEAVQRRTYINENADRLNRVLRDSLSMSDFDLEVHGSPATPEAPPRTGPAAL
ncbi:anoctamin-4 isoform X1 [Diachasma alloeum]|uniref:anoctamin-4 isoform X1 n=1 Tax=Diachasma alloeum TaxID=454923 RepID=UPI0007383150|nr:anoctamin-4 isoform X1 [Diachasma alloeum]